MTDDSQGAFMNFFEFAIWLFAREHPDQKAIVKMRMKEGIYYVIDLLTI